MSGHANLRLAIDEYGCLVFENPANPEEPEAAWATYDDSGVEFADGVLERIVACVNACDGIPTEGISEAMEGARVMAHMMRRWAKQYGTLHTQRDELLAALKEAHGIMLGDNYCAALSRVADAIARAEATK